MKNYDYNEKQRKQIFQNMADNQMINNMNNIQRNFYHQNYKNSEYSKSSNQNRYEENNNFNIQKNINRKYNYEQEQFDFDEEFNKFKNYGRYLEITGYMKKILLFLITIFHISKVKFFSNYKIYILSFLIVEIKIYFHYILFSSKRINIIKKNHINFNKYQKNIKTIKREVDYYIDKNRKVGIGYDIFQIGYGLISDLCLIIILNILGLLLDKKKNE